MDIVTRLEAARGERRATRSQLRTGMPLDLSRRIYESVRAGVIFQARSDAEGRVRQGS
jgi:hypothetical protein